MPKISTSLPQKRSQISSGRIWNIAFCNGLPSVMRRLFLIMLLATSPTLFAEPANTPDAAPQWFQQYLRDFEALKSDRNTKSAVEFVVGNDIWLPGKRFRNGDNWLALVCDGKDCSFAPAALRASTEEMWPSRYDDAPTPGQQLLFTLEGAPKGNTIAWFDSATAPEWLRPGAVSSYPQSFDDETSATSIQLPNSETAKLVPMLLTANQTAQWLGAHHDQYIPSYIPSLLLQLRAEGKRQLLLGELGACSRKFSRNY